MIQVLRSISFPLFISNLSFIHSNVDVQTWMITWKIWFNMIHIEWLVFSDFHSIKFEIKWNWDHDDGNVYFWLWIVEEIKNGIRRLRSMEKNKKNNILIIKFKKILDSPKKKLIIRGMRNIENSIRFNGWIQ